MLLESPDDLLAIRRGNVVSDERLSAKFSHRDDFVCGERMVRRHDQSYFVRHERQRLNRRVIWLESYNADLDAAADDLAGDATGQAAFHFNLDVRMTRAKNWDQRQERHDCVFIRAH